MGYGSRDASHSETVPKQLSNGDSDRDVVEDDVAGGTGAATNADLSDDVEVLIVGPFGRGGIHSYIEEQMDRLDDRLRVSAHESGAPPMGTGRLRFLRGLVMGLVAFLRFPLRSPPDVVHVHTSYGYSFVRKSLYVWYASYVWDVPVVLHVHGSSFDEFLETDSEAIAAFQRRVFGACDEIIVLSEHWKDLVSTRADETKIRVIPNAVDPTTFTADPTDETPHIVFVSTLMERKGVTELTTAIERLAQRHPGRFRVSIAGDGPLSGRVERLADQHEEVTYHGYVSEERKRSLLRDGSIYVLPTYAEGLPIAMLEGMAGANAIVSTPVAAIPEVIGSDRGILVEPGAVDELVDALEALVTSPERRTRMAENNRRAIEDQYSWEHVVDELIDVYATHT